MNIYNKYVIKGIDYIFLNLKNEIKVEDVAQHCNLSKFYFNRLFKAETGDSIYAFVKKLKMEKSAIRLGTDRHQTITDIGIDYGYSASNYSSAFTKYYNISPLKLRKLKKENNFDLKDPYDGIDIIYHNFQYYNDRITIKELPGSSIIFERHIGSYKDMDILWPKFLTTYEHLADNESQYFNITYNDPSLTDKDKCVYDICMTVDEKLILENKKVLIGGKFAIYHFKGPLHEISQAFKGVMNIWFPQIKYKLDRSRIKFAENKKINYENNYIEIDFNIPIK